MLQSHPERPEMPLKDGDELKAGDAIKSPKADELPEQRIALSVNVAETGRYRL